MEAATPAESARTEDPGADFEEQRLNSPLPVATSLKPTACWPPPESVRRNENQLLLRDTAK